VTRTPTLHDPAQSGLTSTVAPAAEPALLRALGLRGGSAVLDRTWWSWAGPHGGLLAAIALRRAGELAGGREPRALTAQFLTALTEGEVPVTAELVREGGSSATVAAALLGPAGRPAVTAVVTSGHGRSAGTPYAVVAPPEVPAWQDCPVVALPVDTVPFAANVEVRAAIGMPMSGGPVAQLAAWIRLREPTPLDAAALTVLCDAMPPALYAATTVPVPVPTVELSVSYSSGLDTDPVSGWVLTRIATRTAGDGWCVDDSEVWTPDGRLLVQARQTRRVLGQLVLA
jgi:hypothetical protein